MLDLALAIAHHIFVFVLFGIVFAEFFALRPGLGRDAVTRLARLDLFYGIDAGLVLIAGFSRVFFAAKGWHYYEHNAFFWAKLGTFALSARSPCRPPSPTCAGRPRARRRTIAM